MVTTESKHSRLNALTTVSQEYLCLYDHKSTIELLKAAGFREVSPSQPFSGQVPDLKLIECSDRTFQAVIALYGVLKSRSDNVYYVSSFFAAPGKPLWSGISGRRSISALEASEKR